MSGINFTQRGSFDNTVRYLEDINTSKISSILEKYGEKGVAALSEATPRDSGLTAESWYYEIVERAGYCSIRWHNSNRQGTTGAPIAILIQYGHATRNGGWVEGRDFIMPAIQPIFDEILADVTEEVTK